MGALISLAVQLESLSCSECGVSYAIAQNYTRERKEDRKSWRCPNGHVQWFPGKTAEDQIAEIKQERDAAREARDRAQEEAWRAQVKARNLRRRISAGVCPCCKRTFVALARHMKAKHPAYGGAPKAVKKP